MNRWVFVNDSKGTTANGSPLTDAELAVIAQAVQIQLNRDYGTECGSAPTLIRVAKNSKDIQPGEKVYAFVDSFKDIPGASAYHDVEGKGVEAAYCAISTCEDVFGPNGIGVDASHECLEDAGNPGCNMAVDDNNGTMHERERCDACEVQAYPIKIGNQEVYVSDFLLDSWQIPGHPGPYTFMAKRKLLGAVDAPGPFQTLPSSNGQGNYQIEFPSGQSQESQVFGRREAWVKGNPKKLQKVMHPTSRVQRILAKHAVVKKA